MEITIPLETIVVVCGGIGLVSYLIRRCERRMKDYVNNHCEKLYDDLYGTDDEINRRIDNEVNNLMSRVDSECQKFSQLNG